MRSTYDNIREIVFLLKELSEISWIEPYQLYERLERPKWMRNHGEQMTLEHFNNALKTFNNKTWYRGLIKTKVLYPISLCLNTEWIQKLACPSHVKENCPYCFNPTLGQLIRNVHHNIESEDYARIRRIQDSFLTENLPDIFIIVMDHNPPYVYDGNNRLIAISTLPDNEDYEISCYVGCKKNV